MSLLYLDFCKLFEEVFNPKINKAIIINLYLQSFIIKLYLQNYILRKTEII